MMLNRRHLSRLLALATTAGLAAASFALAATPDSGTVSSGAPTLTWKGQVSASYGPRILVVASDDDSVPCEQPYCDAFALKVADKDDLTLTGSVPEGTGTGSASVTLRIHKPDGSTLVSTGDATSAKPYAVKIKAAAAGDYTIDYM